MFTNEEIADKVDCRDNIIELLVKPLNDDITDVILPNFSGKQVYLTRIEDLEIDSLIVEKSTPLFTFSISDDDILPENRDSNIFEVDSDFHIKNSNIEQLGKNYIAATKRALHY